MPHLDLRWWTRLRRDELGYVAGFCAFCRGPRAFRLERVTCQGGLPFHLGERKEHHETTCTACGLGGRADPPGYAGSLPGPADWDALKRATRPDFDEVYREPLALEAKLARGTLTVAERADLIARAFGRAEELLRDYDAAPQAGPFARGVVLATAVALAGFFALVRWWEPVGLACFAVFLLGLFVTVYCIATARLWHRRRIVEPALVRALRPLRPTLEELDTVLRVFREKRLLAGRRLRARSLHRLLEQA